MTPAGEITEFDLLAPDSRPYEITTGPDGNLWFTEAGKIGRITTDGVVTEFLSGLNFPAGIAAGSDGNLWFLEYGANRVWRLTTDGAGTPYPIPTSNSGVLSHNARARRCPVVHRVRRRTRSEGSRRCRRQLVTVQEIAPSSGSSAGGMSISIFGTGFQAGATVTIGVPATDVVVESETLITATAPLRVPGTLTDVVVTNPDTATGTLYPGMVRRLPGRRWGGRISRRRREDLPEGDHGRLRRRRPVLPQQPTR